MTNRLKILLPIIFPNTISIVFTDNEIFIKIREINDSMNLEIEHIYLVDNAGFHETFLRQPAESEEYMIILDN